MKKIFTLFTTILMLLVITACSKNEYIPTALITNITYDNTSEILGFQVEITDKSSTINGAIIELYSQTNVVTINYEENHSLYSFENVKSDNEYSIKIKATYELNATLLEDKELYTLDITNYLTTKATFFSSRTFTYTGEKYSIYLSNVGDEYEVKYENNAQSEVGVHEVTAKLYLDGELIQIYTAYLVITQNTPEISLENQTHTYTSNPIYVEYVISNSADTYITYNGSAIAPTNVGEYEIVIQGLNEDGYSVVEANAIMIIEKAHIEIYTSNVVAIENNQQHEITVHTNVECDYTITYNNSTIAPSLAGEYEVIITVLETSNHYSLVKHFTLTILEESQLSYASELFISQVVYTSDYDVIVEIYNPTQNSIALTGYNLMLGSESNNRMIELTGSISSLSTYTIASTSTRYNDITFSQETPYLVVASDDTISLYKNKVIDEVILGQNTNYVRKSTIGFPNSDFNENEWEFYSNDIKITINNHEYNYSETSNLVTYEVYYKQNNYINYEEEVNFNDHITITLSNEIILITNDMILINNININSFGTYNVTFKIGAYEFTTSFTVTDMSPPVITVNDVSLTFSITDTIDYLSLVTVSDYCDNVVVTYEVEELKTGVNCVKYTATDSYGNTSIKYVYINIA